MGPVMNILLAVVVLAVVLAQGAEVPAYLDEPPVVGAVAAGSPRRRSGIRAGDRILTVDGDEVDTWDDLQIAIGTRPNRDVAVTLLRDGQTRCRSTCGPSAEGTVRDRRHRRAARYAIRSSTRSIAGDPAETAGFKPGDVVLAINGERDGPRQQLRHDRSATQRRARSIDLPFSVGTRSSTLHVRRRRSSGDGPWIGIYDRRIRAKSFKPGPLEAVS